MKILLIAPIPPPVGGIALMTSNLMSYFKTADLDINLILCNTSNNLQSITSTSFILRLLTGLTNSIEIYFKVKKILKKEIPQVVHISSSSSLALFKDELILNLANHFGIPVIMHWHFGRIPELYVKHNWEWKLLCHIIKKSTKSIVIDSKSHFTLLNLGLKNVLTIPNTIGLELEQKSRNLLNANNNRQPDRIIFVGHIIKEKGVYELTEACSHIKLIKELIFAGPYEEIVRKELQTIASERENGTWLKFTGTLNNEKVYGLMENSPLLALPSHTEGFPLVVIEAMALGCAIIATDVGAIPEILSLTSDKPCGICVPAQKIESLEKAIFKLIKDPLRTQILGKNGIERVLNNYTMAIVGKKYKSVWEDAALHQDSLASLGRLHY